MSLTYKTQPDWKQLFKKTDIFGKLFDPKNITKLRDVLTKAQQTYPNWDKFKHYKFPDGITAEEAWAYLKLNRQAQKEQTLIKGKNNEDFSYVFTKNFYKCLNYIDTHAAGHLQSLAFESITDSAKSKLMISGLTEEAIATSQIEGANTSRKAAKELLLSQRPARTKDEQMIINGYQVMQRLDELKDLDLSESLLLEIQKHITANTLDDDNDSGRLRTDKDKIVIRNPITQEVVFIPPAEAFLKTELKRLINFANIEQEEFMHPLIKASILHFWIAYLHPFPDGNGRTARAIFHWYLLKKKYSLIKYLSVSRIIKGSRSEYDKSFLDAEHDDNDLTYFLIYLTSATREAIEDFFKYFEKKKREERELKHIAQSFTDLNDRQIELLTYYKKNLHDNVDIKTHQSKHNISYQTARTDLLSLKDKGYLTIIQRGKKWLFIANPKMINRLFK